MNRCQVDLRLRLGRADIAGDIEVVVVFLYLLHANTPCITFNFIWTLLVGLDNFVDMLRQELILAFTLFKMLGGVDKEYIIWLFALFQYKNAHRDAGGEKQVARQTYDRIDMAVFEQLGTNAAFHTASEQHAVGQNDSHSALVAEEVEAV